MLEQGGGGGGGGAERRQMKLLCLTECTSVFLDTDMILITVELQLVL